MADGLEEERYQRKLEASREWKRRNQDKVREGRAAYYAANKEREAEKNEAWRDNNKEKYKQIKRDWYENNKERIASRKREQRRTPEYRAFTNAQQKARYDSDVQYNLAARLRASLTQALRRADVRKSQSTFDLIGCSPQEFKEHLENQFQDGMSWERKSEIHIDHIRPVCSFDLTDPEQVKKCFHYTNLRPLWACDNLSKGSRSD